VDVVQRVLERAGVGAVVFRGEEHEAVEALDQAGPVAGVRVLVLLEVGIAGLVEVAEAVAEFSALVTL
jgi:hypothetical protein